jgi:3-deoxy-manno-octulosonate cytidylyltransferase (CMP-KDO synthetase)
MPRVIAIIPARMQATRFPNKPLYPILGLPLIEHVRRRVALCKDLDKVIVATCDQEIMDVVQKNGGEAIMTKDTYSRCTDRIAEAALHYEADIVINVQGDEPLVQPEMMTHVIAPFKDDQNLQCVNMIAPILDDEEFENQNVPKVVRKLNGDILYISREPIPSKRMSKVKDFKKFNQLGLIAFRYDFLQTFTKLDETPLERIESVDMMRAIEHGYRLASVETSHRMIGVDVLSDVEKVETILKDDSLVKEYLLRQRFN